MRAAPNNSGPLARVSAGWLAFGAHTNLWADATRPNKGANLVTIDCKSQSIPLANLENLRATSKSKSTRSSQPTFTAKGHSGRAQKQLSSSTRPTLRTLERTRVRIDEAGESEWAGAD